VGDGVPPSTSATDRTTGSAPGVAVSAPGAAETTALQPAGGPLSEDWLATIVGLVLVALALLGVIGKGMIP
jgi:hypothetical protein